MMTLGPEGTDGDVDFIKHFFKHRPPARRQDEPSVPESRRDTVTGGAPRDLNPDLVE